MKQNSLIQFVLHVLKKNCIPSYCVSLPCKDWSWCDLGLRSNILNMTSEEILAHSSIRTINPQTVYFIKDGFNCNYIIMMIDKHELFFCGPIMFETITPNHIQEIFTQQQIPENLQEKIYNYCFNILNIPTEPYFYTFFITLAEELYGKDNFKIDMINDNDSTIWHEFQNNFFNISDFPFENIYIIEKRYQTENELLNAVRNSNEKQALELIEKLHQFYSSERITDKLKDKKNYSITLNTLLRKAAEQACVHPIHIDSISNSHVKHIEHFTNIDELLAYHQQMIIDYCRLIRRYTLRKHSLLIQRVLTYIDTNLCADLSLKAFSKSLCVNASYLSSLFKKEMGVSLTEYVNQERIFHAQRLLVSTNLPLKSVANECGIPDIYYFSRIFKKISGMTPKRFRETKTFNDAGLGMTLKE
ncbi:MAG: AraC family transcriptional regulator [Lachnospiraceae bacterium]